jgi:GNAT superfamily N-acetyltransferase
MQAVSREAAERTASRRATRRENELMAAFSQLVEFGKNHQQPPGPGLEVIETPRCRIQLMPDFPLPGPNNVSRIRCTSSEVDDLIEEVRALTAARGLPVMWILDPETEPDDCPDHLKAHGILPDRHDEVSSVMVLPATADVGAPVIPGLEIHDALESLESFTSAEQVREEAFSDIPYGDPMPIDDQRERRYANDKAAGNRRIVMATVDGEPAGAGSLTLFPPDGATMNGGAVRPRFRGLGVYRALVAARLQMARDAGAAGLVVWGGRMSGPILERLGFQTVSWRKFYV